MRIVIELDEQERAPKVIQGEATSVSQPALDGGAPAAALLQAIEGQGSAPTSAPGAFDAGTPPDWLLMAVQAAAPASAPAVASNGSNGATTMNAGSAPEA